MICDRIEMLIVFQWWSRALVCVSCLFRGCVRCWSMVLRPGVLAGALSGLHVFCECFVIAKANANANASASVSASANANANVSASSEVRV